jgi:hypothetical protein
MYYTHVKDSHVKEGMKLLNEKLNQREEIPKDRPTDLNTLQNLSNNSQTECLQIIRLNLRSCLMYSKEFILIIRATHQNINAWL